MAKIWYGYLKALKLYPGQPGLKTQPVIQQRRLKYILEENLLVTLMSTDDLQFSLSRYQTKPSQWIYLNKIGFTMTS